MRAQRCWTALNILAWNAISQCWRGEKGGTGDGQHEPECVQHFVSSPEKTRGQVPTKQEAGLFQPTTAVACHAIELTPEGNFAPV